MSNRLFTDDTGKDILDAIKQQNAIMVKGSNGLKVESYEDVLSIVRMGLAPAVFSVGDIIEVGRETALVASMGAHTGITAAGFMLPQVRIHSWLPWMRQVRRNMRSSLMDPHGSMGTSPSSWPTMVLQ